MTVEQSAIDQAAKSKNELGKLNKLNSTAKNLADEGYDVRVLGEGADQPGDLAVKGPGLENEVPAQSKMLESGKPGAVNKNLVGGTKQAGNGGVTIIDGSKIGLTRENFEQGLKSFLYNTKGRAVAGDPGANGKIIVIFGDGSSAVKTFP